MTSAAARPRWVETAVAGLGVMIVWTLVVKYLVPLHWFWAERLAGRTVERVPVMWDFWPLAHAALAAALWRGARRAWSFAVAVAAAECLVVSVKLVLFARAPEPTLWNLLWLTNKLYVLAFFAVLLGVLLRRRGELVPAPRAR